MVTTLKISVHTVKLLHNDDCFQSNTIAVWQVSYAQAFICTHQPILTTLLQTTKGPKRCADIWKFYTAEWTYEPIAHHGRATSTLIDILQSLYGQWAIRIVPEGKKTLLEREFALGCHPHISSDP